MSKVVFFNHDYVSKARKTADLKKKMAKKKGNGGWVLALALRHSTKCGVPV